MSMEADEDKRDEIVRYMDGYFKDDEMTVEEDLGKPEILDDALVFEVSKDSIFQDAVTLKYLENKDVTKVPDAQRARVRK